MDGIHLLGEWYGCPADTPEFTRADALRALCLDAARDAGLTIVGDRFHQFEPQGVTGTVLLAESHLAIHTWPEARLRHGRRLRLQLHDRQHRQGRSACFARSRPR